MTPLASSQEWLARQVLFFCCHRKVYCISFLPTPLSVIPLTTTMLRTALTGAIARSRVAVTPMARRAPLGKTRIQLENTVC